MGLVAGGPPSFASSPAFTPRPQAAERDPAQVEGYQASFPLQEVPSQERPGLLGHKPEAGKPPQEGSSLHSLTCSWALGFAPPDSAPGTESEHV